MWLCRFSYLIYLGILLMLDCCFKLCEYQYPRPFFSQYQTTASDIVRRRDVDIDTVRRRAKDVKQGDIVRRFGIYRRVSVVSFANGRYPSMWFYSDDLEDGPCRIPYGTTRIGGWNILDDVFDHFDIHSEEFVECVTFRRVREYIFTGIEFRRGIDRRTNFSIFHFGHPPTGDTHTMIYRTRDLAIATSSYAHQLMRIFWETLRRGEDNCLFVSFVWVGARTERVVVDWVIILREICHTPCSQICSSLCHRGVQLTAFVLGTIGFSIGVVLGEMSPGVVYGLHRKLGFAAFCLGGLQTLALFFRPKTTHKFRKYWKSYHHFVGYACVILGVVNVFQGFEVMGTSRSYAKLVYCLCLSATLIGACVALEVNGWVMFCRKAKEEKMKRGGFGGGFDHKGINSRTSNNSNN